MIKTPFELLLDRVNPRLRTFLKPTPVQFKHEEAAMEPRQQLQRLVESQRKQPVWADQLFPHKTEDFFWRQYTLPDGRRAVLIVQGGVERWFVERKEEEEREPVFVEYEFAIYHGLWLAEGVVAGNTGRIYPSSSLLVEFTTGILSEAHTYPQGRIQTGDLESCTGGYWPIIPDELPTGPYTPEQVRSLDAVAAATLPNYNPHFVNSTGVLRDLLQARLLFGGPPNYPTTDGDPAPPSWSYKRSGIVEVIDETTVRFFSIYLSPNDGAGAGYPAGVYAWELTPDPLLLPTVHCYLTAMASGALPESEYRAVRAAVLRTLRYADDVVRVVLSTADVSASPYDTWGWAWNSDGSHAAIVDVQEKQAPNGEPYFENRLVSVSLIDPVAGTCQVTRGSPKRAERQNHNPLWGVWEPGVPRWDLYAAIGVLGVDPDVALDSSCPWFCGFTADDSLDIAEYQGPTKISTLEADSIYQPRVCAYSNCGDESQQNPCGPGAQSDNGSLRSCDGYGSMSKVLAGSTTLIQAGWRSDRFNLVSDRIIGGGAAKKKTELEIVNTQLVQSRWVFVENEGCQDLVPQTWYGWKTSPCCGTSGMRDDIPDEQGVAYVEWEIGNRKRTDHTTYLGQNTRQGCWVARSYADPTVWLYGQYDKEDIIEGSERAEVTENKPISASCGFDYDDDPTSGWAKKLTVYYRILSGGDWVLSGGSNTYPMNASLAGLTPGPSQPIPPTTETNHSARMLFPDGEIEQQYSDGLHEALAFCDLILTYRDEISLGITSAGLQRVYEVTPGGGILLPNWGQAPSSMAPAFRAVGAQ